MLAVLSGPSGVGKDSVLRELRGRLCGICHPISVTTRPPRPGELPGKSYFFVTHEEYDRMLDRGELLAPANVHGNWYGMPVHQVQEALHRGEDVLLKIDVQGAMQLRRRFPQAVFIFLAPPSFAHLCERLVSRSTESPDGLNRRIHDAEFEMAQLPQYDYVVINREGGLEHAVGEVQCIITAERLRVQRQPISIETIDH